MEIQDKNSLLQMFFAAKENSAFSSMGKNTADFAEMLNVGKSEVKVEKSPVDLKKVDIKTDESFKDASFADKKTNDVRKNDDLKSHKSEDNEKESAKTEKVENTAKAEQKSDEKVVAENEAASEKVEKGVEEEVAQEEAVTVENAAGNDERADDVDEFGVVSAVGIENIIVTQKANDFAEEASDVVDMVQVDVEALKTGVKTTKVVEEAKPVVKEENSAEVLAVADKVKVAQFDTVVDESGEKILQPLTEEEALLLEQAKILDEKTGSDRKLKVEVSVKEEKIADTLTKDVLQNRFEVDAMFRAVDNGAEENAEENAEVVVEDVVLQENGDDTLPHVDTMHKPAQGVAFAEGKVVAEAQKVQVADANVLSVSGKEAVFDVANAPKTEVFAKINDASTKDVFKGMSKEVVEQIKVNITKSAIKGVDTIDIQLKPEDLGKIQIKMQISKDGKLQAEIVSSRPETAELLQKEASNLAKAFNDAGFDADERSFNFSFQKENQARDEQKNDSGLSQFIGNTLEQEAENMAGNDNLVYDPVLGLNIRV